MIVGLQIGKDKSMGCPGKNYMKILGRQLNEYSLMAAHNCKYVDRLYVSTDSPAIKSTAITYDATIIDRPPELATPESLTEDVLSHAYEFIKEDLGQAPEMVVLLFANTPMLDRDKLTEAIEILKKDETLDSCFSVAKYNMFSPTRARKLDNNIIDSFVDLNVFDDVSSIRDSQGDVYFADLSIQVMRPCCFEDIDNGKSPFKWMGKKSYGLEIDFGFDIDANWQIPVAEYWLKEHGFEDDKTPYGEK
jgi:CMP-N-acetylneuraminic acid synthetase